MSEIHVTTPPLPSLQALRVLEAAVRHQSFTEAARELGLTHGAVSRQVDALEAWVGSELFTRSGRRMIPSEEARRLVTQCRGALRILEDAFGHPLTRKAVPGLRLSTTHVFARCWLLPRLKRLRAEFPGLIASLDTSSALVAGMARDVDVAVRYGPGGWPDVQSERLGSEILFPVAAPELAQFGSDWTEADLISTPYQSWRAWFHAAGLQPPAQISKAFHVGDSALALDAAAAGLGVALARQRLAKVDLQSGRLVRLSPESVEDVYAYYAVWPTDTRKQDQIEVLLGWLRHEFAAEAL